MGNTTRNSEAPSIANVMPCPCVSGRWQDPVGFRGLHSAQALTFSLYQLMYIVGTDVSAGHSVKRKHLYVGLHYF